MSQIPPEVVASRKERHCFPLVDQDGKQTGTICRGPRLSPPVPTLSKWRHWNRRVFTDCCARWERPKNTTVRSGFQEWYGWTHVIECAEGRGCRATPRLANGRGLRAMCHDGG